EEIPTQIATTSLFSILGVNPILGRTFNPDDGGQGKPNVVVLSYGLWQRRFGGDPQIVGRKLILDNRDAIVIGVMPADFNWHIKNGSNTRKMAEMWSPWQVGERSRQRKGRFASAVARLKPGVSIEQAQGEMSSIGARLERQYNEFNANWGVNVV